MRPNSEKLIKHLLESQPKTSNQLAELLQVSVRSIKNYAKEINEEHPNLLTSSNDGYSVNIDQALLYLILRMNIFPKHRKNAYSISSTN